MEREDPPDFPDDRYEFGDARRTGRLTSSWSAFDRRLERPVVIHALRDDLAGDDEVRDRLTQRLREAARVDHPGVARIYDVVQGDRLAVVLEHTGVDDYRRRVRAGSTLGTAEAVDVASTIADAIDACHDDGVTHGGLTLSSIGETDDGRIVVNDIGTGGDDDAAGDETIRGDIAALAGLVHELVVGRPPHFSGAFGEVDPSLPASFAGPVNDALEGGRFSSASEFVRALRSTSTAAATPTTFANERKWLIPALAVLCIGGLLVLIGTALGRTETGRNIIDNARDAVGLSGPVVRETTTTTTEAVSTTTSTTPLVVRDIEIARLLDFDPSGDGAESPNRLPLVNDGDPTRGWQTERYTTAEFGNLKDGVGLLIEVDEAAVVNEIVVRSPSRGWAFELYASTERAAVVDDWGDPIASASDISADVTLADFGDPTTPGSLLLWITRLGEGPEHRVVITDIDLTGTDSA